MLTKDKKKTQSRAGEMRQTNSLICLSCFQAKKKKDLCKTKIATSTTN